MVSESGFSRGAGVMMSVVFAVYIPTCGTPKVMRSGSPTYAPPMAELWQRPDEVARRDLFYGPWGEKLAPDPQAAYTFEAKKQHGTNPGVTVRDHLGREWHVKQAPHNDQGAEGPVEVVLHRA